MLKSLIVVAVIVCTAGLVPAQTPLASGLYERGYSFVRRNEYRKAIPYLKEATNQDATYAKAWLQLGYCLVRTGEGTSALDMYKHVLALQPESAQTYCYLAEAHQRLGKHEKAVVDYQKAVSLKEDYAEAYYGLGLSYLALGDRVGARKQQMLLEVVGDKSYLHAMLEEALDFSARPRFEYPGDEAAKDLSFASFYDKLTQAVRRRDTAFLLSNIAPNIDNGHDDHTERQIPTGIVAFKRRWALQKSDSALWGVMNRILSDGGRWENRGGKQGKVFVAPWVRAEASNDGLMWTVLKTNVAVRTQPSNAAPAVGMFSRDVVLELDGPGEEDSGWIRVLLAGGKQGYVSIKETMYPPNAFYAEFRKIKGRWFLTSLTEAACC